MEPITISKEYFIEWTKENNWLLVREGSDKGFPLQQFLTPSGQMVIVTYSNDDNLRTVGIAMPPPVQQAPFQNPMGGMPFMPRPPGFQG